MLEPFLSLLISFPHVCFPICFSLIVGTYLHMFVIVVLLLVVLLVLPSSCSDVVVLLGFIVVSL